jgi:hypothetical protein
MESSVEGKYSVEDMKKSVETTYVNLIQKRKMELVSVLANNNNLINQQ